MAADGAAEVPSDGVAAPVIRRTDLSGGPVVVTDEMPGSRSVSLGAWLRVGSRDEPPVRQGVTHFLEHLLFKGTARRSPLDVVLDVERVGGDVNAYTAPEHMVVHCRVPARHLGVAVDVLTDVVTAPRLDPSDVELERRVILDEIAGSAEQAEEEAARVAAERFFPDHGLGREGLGTRATVGALDRDTVVDWFERCCGRHRMVVAAAGGVTHADVVAAVQAALPADTGQAAPPGPAARCAPGPPRPGKVHVRRPAEQSHLVVGWRSLPAGHGRRWAEAALVQILGGGMSSRLFQAVREERGLVYAIDARTSSYTDAGTVDVVTAADPDDVEEVMGLIRAEVDDLVLRGPGDGELEAAIGFLAGSLELAEEDSGSRMVVLGASVCDRDRLPDLDADLAALRAVTAADVAEVAAEVLAVEPVTVVVSPT